MYHIDKSKKPKKLSLFLSKPNTSRTTIGKLNHIYGEKLTVNFGQINELTFTIPYEVVIKNELVRNPHIDKVREKYLIKAKFGESVEWFIITRINKTSNESDSLTVQCFSLGYQLRYGKMINYEASSYNCLQVLEDCLKGTSWKVGYINPDFNLKYRQFDVSSKTKLEFLYEIAETFEGTVIFDTAKKEINIYKEEEISQYKGFWITYGKYLNTVDEDIDADEIVTRLYVTGSDGLTINSINPTGQSYVDDFSYFLYPFKMDGEGNVESSSYFMEDDLAIALTKYNQYVSVNKDIFGTLLKKKKDRQQELVEEQNKLTVLNNELQMILDSIEVAKINGDSTTENIRKRNNRNNEITKQEEIVANIELKIKSVDSEIEKLKNDLSIENHLSQSQMDELSNFIHVEEWSDDNQIDVNELYEAALKRISEINSPPINIKANIVNFFKMVTESHNWDKLNIGDIIKIKHDKLNILVQTKVSQLVFDFENDNIDITISNSKKLESDLDKIKRAFYTIGKVETDYNNRKINWNQIARNFNLRNDRIKEKPVNPVIPSSALSHAPNDDGSVNLILNWDYPDYSETKKNEHNIDGFLIYLHYDASNQSYVFGSKIASETVVDVSYALKSYTFPSVPANLFYTVGIRAYRRVDEDIDSEGILMSDLVRFNDILGGISSEVQSVNKTQTMSISAMSILNTDSSTIQESVQLEDSYQPSTEVNINGRLNGSNYTVSAEEPTNPRVNDVWVNFHDAKPRVWNGMEWKVSNDVGIANDYTDRTISESEQRIRDDVEQALEEVDLAMVNVNNEVDRIETEVVPAVEQAINETYIPRQSTSPTEVPASGLWWDTSVDPPRLKRYNYTTLIWEPVAPTEAEVDSLIDEMRNSVTVEYKQYTDAEILATEQAIQTDLSTRIGNVNTEITNLHTKATNLQSSVSTIQGDMTNLQTSIATDIDTLNTKASGLETKIITDVANLQGLIDANKTNITSHGGEITTIKEDVNAIEGQYLLHAQTLTDLDGQMGSAETQIGLNSTAISLRATKEEVNTALNEKVDKATYSSKIAEIELNADGISQSVSSIESTIGTGAVGEAGTIKSDISKIDQKADEIQLSVTSLDKTVTTQGTTISDHETRIGLNETGISLKANANDVFTKTEMNTELGKKVDTTTYNSKMSSLDVSIQGIQANVSSVESDVSGVDSRLTSAQSQIDVQAGQISAKAEKSSVYTKTEADGKISTAINSAKAEIKVTTDGISQSVTNVSNKVDNEIKSSGNWTNTYSVNTADPKILTDNKGVALSDAYSYEVQARTTATGTESTAIAYFLSKGDGLGWTLEKTYEMGKSSNHPEFFIDSTGKPSIRLYGHTSRYTVEIKFSAYRGRTVPSKQVLDDANKGISDVQSFASSIDQKADSIQTSVSSLTQTVNSQGTKISNAESTISQNTTSIGLKANATDVYTKTQVNTELGKKVSTTTYNTKMGQLDVAIDGISGRVTNTEVEIDDLTGEVSSAKSQIASLDVKADGIATSVSDVRENLENLQIGGRNLIPNSGNFKEVGSWSQYTSVDVVEKDGFQAISGGNNTIATPNLHVLESNTEYVCTAEFMFDVEFNAVYHIPNHIYVRKVSNGGNAYSSLEILGGNRLLKANTWEKVSVKFKTIDTIEQLYFKFHLYTGGTTANKWLKSVKLEKGNKATDWTPAPEDVDSRLTSAETKIDQTAYDLTLKASQTSVNSLTGRMSSAEATLSIQAGQISTKVEKNGVISAFNQTSETIKMTASKIDLAGLVSILNADGTTGTLINGNKLVTSSITAAKLNVNEIFGNSAVIAKIKSDSIATANLSATKITTGTLDAAKVSVVNLSASSILTGTLDASKVNVANLNANNIKTGVLTAIDIQGVNISGSTLTSSIDSTNYTKIESSYLESRGTFSRTWLGLTSTHDIRLRFQNGYFRARNDTLNRSLYYSDFGISTYVDGEGEGGGSSGSLVWWDKRYSGAGSNGITLSSYGGVVALESELNRIVLNSKQSVNLESKDAPIYLRPFDGALAGNNTFAFRLVEGTGTANDGMMYFGSEVNGYGVGMRFSKSPSFSTIWITDGNGVRGGNSTIVAGHLAGNIVRSEGSEFMYVGSTSEIRTVKASNWSSGDIVYIPIRSQFVYADALDVNGGVNLYIRPVSTGEVRVTATGSTSSYRPIRAREFITDTSLRDNKKDIEVYSEKVLSVFRNSSVYTYRRKSDDQNAFKQLGMMIDETPRILHGEAGDSFDLYASISYAYKGIKELIGETDNHEDRINLLEIENQYLKEKIANIESKLNFQ